MVRVSPDTHAQIERCSDETGLPFGSVVNLATRAITLLKRRDLDRLVAEERSRARKVRQRGAAAVSA